MRSKEWAKTIRRGRGAVLFNLKLTKILVGFHKTYHSFTKKNKRLNSVNCETPNSSKEAKRAGVFRTSLIP